MHPKGWMTLGDIGHLDEDGYLFLTDRKSHMIISGGVNIYPQEIENLLVTHDKVMDAAVIGAPCPDFGEKVVAVVQPMDMADAGEALEAELRAHCKRLNLDDRVRFLGWRNDRGALLAACDVVAFPSRYEPFGTVTVDAWAASRPLVAADAVGPAAYVKDGENGVLIPKNDVDALANALSKVITDKAFAAKIVAGGRASYEAQFNKAAFQRDSKAFYEKIIAHAGPFPG
jgi:glycosyltransferase involved in cell wall biosynthesis